jgi:hypothetical protein
MARRWRGQDSVYSSNIVNLPRRFDHAAVCCMAFKVELAGRIALRGVDVLN